MKTVQAFILGALVTAVLLGLPGCEKSDAQRHAERGQEAGHLAGANGACIPWVAAGGYSGVVYTWLCERAEGRVLCSTTECIAAPSALLP